MIRLRGSEHRPRARRSWLVLAFVALAACMPLPAGGLRTTCDASTVCKLDGELRFDPVRSALVLELSPKACSVAERVRDASGRQRVRRQYCLPSETRIWSQVRLITPWQQELHPIDAGPDWVSFQIDFSKADIDPLAPDAPARLERPWTLVHTGTESTERTWTPGAAERAEMLMLVGERTFTQITVEEVNVPPTLVVKELFHAGELRNGTAAELVLTVANTGSGTAYRVIARTRSNIPALHGLQFSFGKLEPHEAKTRRVKVELPRDNDENQALIVLAFEEAHQFAPEPISRRFPVKPATIAARLAMGCRVLGQDTPRPAVDAGQVLAVECTVRNDGSRATGVRVAATLTGVPRPVESEAFELDTSKQNTITLALQVPRGAALDSQLALTLRVRHDGSKHFQEVVLPLVVARPRICPHGKLTREAFTKKRAELRGTLDAGLISQDEYDRYEAELVGCLE